ncbi:MAG: phosphatase PAP2 family protein [Acidobacteria bacterium]|nr:phosphatase PAP2 family protein [Acidobacteriota bacterium]
MYRSHSRFAALTVMMALALCAPALAQAPADPACGPAQERTAQPGEAAGPQSSSAGKPSGSQDSAQPSTPCPAPGEPAPAAPGAPVSSPAPEQTQSLHTLFRDLASDFKHLPSRESLIIAGAGGALSAGVHPLDDDFNQKLANSGSFFKAGDVMGNSATLFGASMTVYGLGRLTGRTRLSHVGLDLLRSQIITESIVQSMKQAVRRPRPDGSGGFGFPSGHSAMTFATAAVIQRHHGLKWSIPLYVFATYVATSRLHDNVHSLSDVVFGAAVGTIAGRTVTRHGNSAFTITPIVTPGGGKGVAFVKTW